MFATTRWSLVRAADEGDSPSARRALAELCGLYWYPLYAFIRRRGHGHDQAQDLTQEFFARLLQRQDFAAADPAHGRFRSFLLAACKHFLANEYNRAHALKRGGGLQPLPLDFGDADDRYTREPAHDETPEKLFERRWALTLLQHVLARLRQEYEANGKETLFEQLKGHLTGADTQSHAAAAAVLGMSAGAVKVAAHRLRQRYRDLLREEIGQTIADPAQIDDEVQALFAALA
jgi:RNA polymerase sigma-70 factor (ECF subfamily)